jgi:hypothetical protein
MTLGYTDRIGDEEMQDPSSIRWSDSTPATLSDYWDHQLDTHMFRVDAAGGVTQYMYPEILASVAYEKDVMDWVVRGPRVVTAALRLSDPNAEDGQIISQLSSLPVVYRSNIIRAAPTGLTAAELGPATG